MLRRRPACPLLVTGGPENPAWCATLYLGSSFTVLRLNERGRSERRCRRLHLQRNEDVIDLYGRSGGAKVVVL
jgi:hypothetical protein